MEEEAHEKGRVAYNQDDYSLSYYLKEAVNSILKCLGLESSSRAKENCSENENEKQKFICQHHEQSCQDNQFSSSSDGREPTVPTSTDLTDPPTTNGPLIENLGRRGRTPPRPPVSGGPDPRTNRNPFT